MKRMLLLLAVAAVLAAMLVVTTGPALAKSTVIQGNNGNHFGDISNPDSGNHTGRGIGGGRFK